MLKPSEYQQNIYDWQEAGRGDAFVSACAGSGKTTVLVELAKRLPIHLQQSAVFIAFNKHIAEELAKRLPRGVKAATIHSLGMQALRNHLRPGSGWKVDAGKYRALIRAYLQGNGIGYYDKQFGEAVDTMGDLVRFTMVTLADPTDLKAVADLAIRYGISLPFPDTQIAGVATVLQWGIDGMPGRDPKTGLSYSMQEAISFDDMIYLPNRLDLSVEQYQMLYVDEAQDLNEAQTDLVMKMRAPGGRIVLVGDPRQAIYAFCGANSDSVERIIARTGAQTLPLNVCYRCPKSHLKLAQQIVPSIEPAPGAIEGVAGDIMETQLSSAVRAGDLILCRCTAPLISLVFELLTAGVAAKVRGRDIGASLVKIIDIVEKAPDYQFEAFPACMEAYRSGQVHTLSQREGTEMQIESLCDRVDSLIAIHANLIGQGRCHNAGDLRSYIASLFDDSRAPVMLSTIHKAKGLEADRVFILRYDLMPHKMAKTPDAIAQEHNLRYIALTRAKRELYFITEEKAKAKTAPAVETPAPTAATPEKPPTTSDAPAAASSISKFDLARAEACEGRAAMDREAEERVRRMPVQWQWAFGDVVSAGKRLEDAGGVATGFTQILREDSMKASLQQLHARVQILSDMLEDAR
jgi:hypothetical protein